ncbi:ATP-binding protein [Ensifer sp. ENS05]|uniref:ATP-binding protein n=1 Tax=Ensifer sp. ENS05 TaxID=2769277 RepID=UPI0035C75265
MNLPSTRRATRATESTNLSFSEWATVFGDAKITAFLDRLTTVAISWKPQNGSFRFKARSAAAAQKRGEKLSSAWKPTGLSLPFIRRRFHRLGDPKLDPRYEAVRMFAAEVI